MKHGKIVAAALLLIIAALIGAYVYLSHTHAGKVRDISVILRNDEGGIWDAALLGMEDAAREKNINLHFISFEGEDEHTQAMHREIGRAVSAVIMEPCTGDITLNRGMRNTVIIQLGGRALDNLPAIAPDNEALGRDLAKLALRGDALESGVRIAEPAYLDTAADQRIQGLCAELDSLGIAYTRLKISQNRDASRDELRALANAARGGCILTVEPSTLLRCGYRLFESDITNVALYGVGMSHEINALIEAGYIDAILAVDQYKEGYLAVTTAVAVLEGRLPQRGGGQILPHAEISADTLYSEENLYLLHPFAE